MDDYGMLIRDELFKIDWGHQRVAERE